jgi:hypothetical protein
MLAQLGRLHAQVVGWHVVCWKRPDVEHERQHAHGNFWVAHVDRVWRGVAPQDVAPVAAPHQHDVPEILVLPPFLVVGEQRPEDFAHNPLESRRLAPHGPRVELIGQPARNGNRSHKNCLQESEIHPNRIGYRDLLACLYHDILEVLENPVRELVVALHSLDLCLICTRGINRVYFFLENGN